LVLFALCLMYIVPGLVGRDPWKTEDAAGFGIMWTMARGGLEDWLWPNVAGLPMAEKGPLAYWIGAAAIKLFGGLLGDPVAARVSTAIFFLIGSASVWYTTYLFGRRPEAQPLRLAFGGQPEPKDYGRTLADGALLIYLGSMGLLLHSHSTSTEALLVALVAFSLYAAAWLFEERSPRAALVLGMGLGLLALTRGWIVPLALWLALMGLALLMRGRKNLALLALLTLPAALAVSAVWLIPIHLVQPFGSSPFDAWMTWSAAQIGFPTLNALRYFLKNGLWFTWPAWPFAIWAVYAWRKQIDAFHIAMPLAFLLSFLVLLALSVHQEEGILLPLLPPLAILAAFGLPTMKRGAINAVDWFSVMTLTTCAGFIWIGWIAKQTGWPAQIARNAFKLAPGFKPEFNLFAVLIAAIATAGWIAVVHWRISRKPSVLWRAVVLSSGGVILCWLLLMTLWLPWINYGKSYNGVAHQIAEKLPEGRNYCVDSDVGPAQRASFAFFGDIPFAGFNGGKCDFLLLQDKSRKKTEQKVMTRDNQQWRLLWEGRRPSDRDERYRLYQRIAR
jgi:4-amino-4-deoxy-L-arabinose transferase-like glycosyltransferase